MIIDVIPVPFWLGESRRDNKPDRDFILKTEGFREDASMPSMAQAFVCAIAIRITIKKTDHPERSEGSCHIKVNSVVASG